MAVSIIASASSKTVAAGTSIADFTLTLSSSYANVAVAVLVAWQAKGITSPSVSVGGVALSPVSGTDTASNGITSRTAIFAGPLGSASGAKTVAINWTGTSIAAATALAVDGCDQATPVQRGSCVYGTNPASGDLSIQVPLTGSADGVTVAVGLGQSGNALRSCLETEIYNTRVSFTIGVATASATGETSPTHGWTFYGYERYQMSGADFAAAVTGQFVRPSSDVADGGWVNQDGSNTNLYAAIDEEIADDADFIVSNAILTADACTIGLSAISTPAAGTVTMRIRAKYV